MIKVSSFDEFSKLNTAILGTLEKNILPIESQDPNADLSEGLKLLEKAFPTWYVDEVNEDIEGFKKVLEQNDVKVLRPKWPFKDSTFRSPNWLTNGYDIYNVRDNQIIFGNNIVSTPPSSRYRQNEYFAFYEIFQDLQKDPNTRWVSVPKPSLPKGF